MIEKSALRLRAEEKSAPSLHYIETQTTEQIQEMLHELRVHQIELEMQNEELRRVQLKLETERARYYAFYNMAPVGFLTVSGQGLILEANIIAAAMLGTTAKSLVNQPITRFIFREDQDIFYLIQKRHCGTRKEPVRNSAQTTCAGDARADELRMTKKDGTTFWARMESLIVQDPLLNSGYGNDDATVCRVVVTDITGRKNTEEALQKAFDDIKTLHGILPICAWCKKIRDDEGYWSQVEEYLHDHTEAEFTHGICPECCEKQFSVIAETRQVHTGKKEP